MRILLNYLRSFVKEHFNIRLYVLFLVFCAGIITVNYALDLEDGFLDRIDNFWLRSLGFFAVHAISFYAVLFLARIITKEKWKHSRIFWLKSLLAFAIIGLDRGLHLYPMIRNLAEPQVTRFWLLVSHHLQSLVTLIIPLAIIYFIFDRKERFGFYGLRFKRINFWPYWIMFFIMIPLIFIASFNAGIQDYYPTLKRAGIQLAQRYYQVDELLLTLLYEITYLSDFLNVEMFFRGFLIVGLMKYVGKDVVLAMAATYAVLHFGKPMMECISSIFGGYILGILAFKGRNIWGGVYIHMGVALLMEIFGSFRM